MGQTIECTPSQAVKLLELASKTTANAKGTTNPVEVDWNVIKTAQTKAVANVSGDTPEEYILNVLNASPKTSTGKPYPIHVVFSGLNAETRKRFGIDDPRLITDLMVKKNLITTRPVKGGAMINLA